jgi:hypothetical protein
MRYEDLVILLWFVRFGAKNAPQNSEGGTHGLKKMKSHGASRNNTSVHL